MEKHIHDFAQGLEDFSTIVFHLHVAALVIINVTKSPQANSILWRTYRCLEMLAGLLTPLSKR
jgi:hypothetical protein